MFKGTLLSMKKLLLLLFSFALFGLWSERNVQSVHASTIASERLYRLYNPNSGEHFYTKARLEKQQLVALGWQDEGTGWYAPVTGEAVYRLYNPNAGDHHYTLSAGEKEALVAKGWRYEGVGWYSAPSNADYAKPLYRAYNPNALAGSHNYTLNKAEQTYLTSLGWQDEAIAWYGVNLPSPLIVDLSEWQSPSKIDYDTLANQIDGAIVRVYTGYRADNNYQRHLTELQKRGVPVAVYAYVAPSDTLAEINAQATQFYHLASSFQPKFYWLDVEDEYLSGGLTDGTSIRDAMESYRLTLATNGASKIGAYIANNRFATFNLDTTKFQAIWVPTYGDNSGYYENNAPDSTENFALHQYTSTARLKGYDGSLDLNRLSGQVSFAQLFS
ncbi:GH25 family lysozyme [Enterococcus columbae]|nr:GH25 family lysozyme [Enterococcus columbae]OJG24705.1 hypothetical protein RR47_GL002299 [Enterococcus columbae DSM 7374 = ATCC 51263]